MSTLLELSGMLENQLFHRTNSEPYKCVYCSQININMERFTWAKLTDIRLVYGAVYGNGGEAQRVHHERFPNRMCPDTHMFAFVDRRLQETGTFAVNRQNTWQGQSIHMPQFDDGLQRFENNPSKSTCTVGHTVGVNRCHVWNGVCKQQLHLYHQQRVQALDPNDYHHRGQCVHWFVHQSTEKPIFPSVVLFVDEACFTNGGIFWQSQQPFLTRRNPSCYIYSLLPTLLCGQLSGWHCAGLLVILMAQCTDLLCVFGGKLPQMLEKIPLAQRGCGSLGTSGPRTSHCHLQQLLDWTGWACGLGFQVTGLHTIGLLLIGPH